MTDRLEAERAELDSVLGSGMLGRTNNLVRLLGFVCEKYFEGKINEIKEYSIAVEAFGRSGDFDPQVDTIVRVTAHALRKRLEHYYRSAGAPHSVQICLPPGHYVPKFIHKGDLEERARSESNEGRVSQFLDDAPPLEDRVQHAERDDSVARRPEPALKDLHLTQGPEPRRDFTFPIRSTWFAAIVFLLVCVPSLLWYRSSRPGTQGNPQAPVLAGAISTGGGALRATAGGDGAAYVDRAGLTWESDHFCSGGSSFSVARHAIQGTEDPQIFSAGRRGIFHCDYPVPPGTYEVHLLFAETSGLLENSRNMGFSINGGPANNLDVVDDAGGDDIATTKVFTDVQPQKDGMIHLAFNTPDSFLNAVEILPGTPHRMLPVRITAGPSPYRDAKGNVWMPDRYFFGGRINRLPTDLSKVPDGRLFEWHRYGHFHYAVPVAAGGTYTLRLYFLEHWFGLQNGSAGGVGSRVFDVSCNGSMLLKRFDILSEAGVEPLIKTFPHIEPTGQGKIEIYFTPATNYPSVSAIEVIPE